jgi:tetratricopeptide (TPR) repeat protein
LAGIANHRGNYIRAEEFHLASLALLREIGAATGEIATVFNMLGEVARTRGDFAAAVSYYRDCLAMYPDDRWAQHNLGHVLLRQGEVAEAEAWFGHSLAISQQWGNPQYMASTLGGFAGIAGARHQSQRAARLFGVADALFKGRGVGLAGAADQADWDHNLAAARAQLDGQAWDAAWAEGAAMTEDEAMAYALAEKSHDE